MQQTTVIVGGGAYDPSCAWIFWAVSCFTGFCGLHRMYLGDVCMGIVYLFTLGFCGIGALVDCCKMDQLVSEANTKFAPTVVIGQAPGQPYVGGYQPYAPPTYAQPQYGQSPY